jgi:hypothetical protein
MRAESGTTRNKTLQKLWSFTEGPILWGAIGVVIGAIAPLLPVMRFFAVAWLFLILAVVRGRFFEGKGWAKIILGNVLLSLIAGAGLFVLGKTIPKPKEPPTVEEIATAVIKKQKEDIHQIQGTPPTQDQDKSNGHTSSLPTAPKKKQPNSKPQQQQTAPDASTQTPSGPSPQQTRLTISQKPEVSSRQDAPYKTEVVVQTTTEFPSLKMVIQCDKPLLDGSAGVGSGGVIMITSQGVVKDHPNLFLFTYQSAMPPFGPASPIVFNLWSKEPIKCDQVATF